MALTKSLRKWLKEEVADSDLFFVDSATLTATEASFVKRCHEHLRKVHRPSWPDFIVSSDGRLFGVEVKTPTDQFRPNQIRTFNLLTNAGVMDIYVWFSSRPDKLIPWTKARRSLQGVTSRR